MLKNIIKFLALFLGFLCVFFFLKKMQNPTIQNSETVTLEDNVYEKSLPDDFHKFYNQYHTDSTFQLERTLFPLKGLAQSTDSTKIAEEVMWQKENWVLHKPFNDQNGTFERTFTNVGGIITESISANEGMFTLEKRYAKLEEKWHLIYYQELLMLG